MGTQLGHPGVKQRVCLSAKAQDGPNQEPPGLWLRGVKRGPCPRSGCLHQATIVPSLVGRGWYGHERVLEVEDQSFDLAQRGGEGEIGGVVGETRKNLSLREGHAQIHEIPTQVLNQSMLAAAAGERLDDVPERRGMAFTTKRAFGRGPIDVEPREALVQQLLELGLSWAFA